MDASRRAELTQRLRELQNGDRRSFRVVFDMLWPVLLAFTRRLGPAEADAEDAAQRALIRVFGRIDEFDADRDGLTWALAIAAYEVRTLQRQSQRRRESSGHVFENMESDRDEIEAVLLRARFSSALDEALSTLSPADRDCILFLLRDQDSEVGPQSDAARKRRQRALERLRVAVRRLYAE